MVNLVGRSTIADEFIIWQPQRKLGSLLEDKNTMLSQRQLQPEIMDDPSLDSQAHAAALRGLQRVHRLSGTVGRLWRPIERLITSQRLEQLTVMDVGCGDGWILRQLWQRAARRGCRLQLVGCDFSSRALELCGQACERSAIPISLHTVDVTQQPLPGPADVVINSFFLHHFTEAEVLSILRQMAASTRRLLVIEDLLRSRLGYALCWVGVHALTRCRVVHVDGLLSVRAAFSAAEIANLLQQSNLASARVDKRWPERILITWQPASSPPAQTGESEYAVHA